MWKSLVAPTCPYPGPLATCSLIARATAAPPATASEPPSQKSFWTSTMMSARMGPTVSSRPGRPDPGGTPGRHDAGGVMARAGYWNHNVHYQPVILRAVPPGCGAALEVGCGDGLLASKLAERCAEGAAIDRDAQMT